MPDVPALLNFDLIVNPRISGGRHSGSMIKAGDSIAIPDIPPDVAHLTPARD
jgi:hypothetical protein